MDICEDSNDSTAVYCKECVICGQFMESTEERPIGLIVFMHSSTGNIISIKSNTSSLHLVILLVLKTQVVEKT